MPHPSLLAVATFCWLSCALTLRAGEPSPTPQHPRIWSGLILATNGAHPGEAPDHLRKVAGKLRNIFGYNQFEVIGESSERMDDANERWLIPSKDFYMSVTSPNGPGPKNQTKIILFQNRRRLAELEAHLGPDSPLFIRGPQYAHGQLVIVVRIADPSEFPEERLPATTMLPVRRAGPSAANQAASPPRAQQHIVNVPPPPVAMPVDRFHPRPDNHLGPLPGEGHGDMDSKTGRP